MSEIRFLSSMVMDAICTINNIENHDECSNSDAQKKKLEFLDILKSQSEGFFVRGGMSYSTVCLVISTYTQNEGLDTMSLDELCNIFTNIDKVDKIVRERTKSEFTASFLFPTLDALKTEWAQIYITYIKKLKEIGFETLWREYAYPLEKTQAEKLKEMTKDVDVDGLLELVSGLKNEPKRVHTTTYISLMSYPVSFTLYDGSFLDALNYYDGNEPYQFASIIAHELMHGFASKELIRIYLDFMKTSRYLSSTHKSLLEEMGSGDEEEFVMAAEYYIVWKLGIVSKEKIITDKYSRYAGSVPLSLFVFDLMTLEGKDIKDYNSFLIETFSSEFFTSENVLQTLDDMLPVPNNLTNFYNCLFSLFRTCTYIFRKAQFDEIKDFEEKVEQLFDERFSENHDRKVKFSYGEQTISDKVNRKTIVKNGITIDVVTFETKKEALKFDFKYGGANITPYNIVIDGEDISKPYIVNWHAENNSVKIEIAFVCNTTRYLLTADCAVTEEIDFSNGDWYKDDNAKNVYSKSIRALRKSMFVILLLDKT
ncbi:MAG: hypothetical protein PHV95_05485 [Eubacteriales bacterium]|nr:hypothetical protein [Eubacteriales bacterium]